MSVFQCKMCGGSLAQLQGGTVCVCEYCGTRQTISPSRDEVTAGLFNRANGLRMRSDFDKAEEVYEKIVEANPQDAEAYWGIVLCKYGIEYVEDPASGKRVPTCHRTLFEAVKASAEYQSAIQYADAMQRTVYEAEADAIDTLQKDILAVASREEPFDVFICYKETDSMGRRTVDSTIANDLYHYLTGEGFKVFFAAITLEDKLGREYEPYIFAALQSAKVMLVLGTRPEYFSAVWVKNEWSRFLKLVKTDRSRLIIPCYRDMDPYNLPEEFAHLQAQDMSKLGFVQDIVRGIKKVLGDKQKTQTFGNSPSQAPQSGQVATLLKRVEIFLEDGDWSSADDYCEKILDIDPECSEAYLGKLMAELEIRGRNAIEECRRPINGNSNYHKIIKFGDDELRRQMAHYSAVTIFNFALMLRAHAETAEDFRAAGEKFATVGHFKNARELADDCFRRANEMYQNGYVYQQQPLYGAPQPRYQQYNQGQDQLGNFFNRVEDEIRRVDNNLGTNFFKKR